MIRALLKADERRREKAEVLRRRIEALKVKNTACHDSINARAQKEAAAADTATASTATAGLSAGGPLPSAQHLAVLHLEVWLVEEHESAATAAAAEWSLGWPSPSPPSKEATEKEVLALLASHHSEKNEEG